MFHYMNDIFRSIDIYNPHLWIWLGDAAYTDSVINGLCIIQYCLTFKALFLLCYNLVNEDRAMDDDYVKKRF